MPFSPSSAELKQNNDFIKFQMSDHFLFIMHIHTKINHDKLIKERLDNVKSNTPHAQGQSPGSICTDGSIKT